MGLKTQYLSRGGVVYMETLEFSSNLSSALCQKVKIFWYGYLKIYIEHLSFDLFICVPNIF